MSFRDMFNKSRRLTTNVSVQLTPTGRQKADKFEGVGARFQIMSALAEAGGTATIGEIAQEAHVSEDQVQAVIRSLIHSQYARVVRADEVGGE